MTSAQVQSGRSQLKGVCFDYRGVLLDHRTDRDILLGMEELLETLKKKGTRMAIVSRFPLDVLKEGIESLLPVFGGEFRSSSGRTKLECIRELAEGWEIDDLEGISFIDDKPENLVSVRQYSKVHVIGFRGSGKYPQSRDLCLNEGIPFAESVEELKHLLLDEV
ncbi:MAG TPA: hypothetical protein VEF34_19675 [Syntrophobacteraceae bacterium]|nr:hypothetical protein [Syntrophobacteraceae bacterium]